MGIAPTHILDQLDFFGCMLIGWDGDGDGVNDRGETLVCRHSGASNDKYTGGLSYI